MKEVTPDSTWPESWQLSYKYDLMELYGDNRIRGYCYAYQSRFQNTLELVKMVASPPARILDVAAAQGNFSLRLAEDGFHVTWNDLREELIDYVRLKYEKGSLEFMPGNVFELKPEALFDVVLITEIIEHVAHPDEFLEHIAKLLKPGGHIVMTTPLGNYFRNHLPKFSDCPDPSQFEAMQFKPNSDGHIFLLHLDEIYDLAKRSHLEVVDLRLSSNPLTSGHVKLETALKVLPRRLVFGLEGVSRRLPRKIAAKFHSGVAVLLRRREP